MLRPVIAEMVRESSIVVENLLAPNALRIRNHHWQSRPRYESYGTSHQAIFQAVVLATSDYGNNGSGYIPDE